MTSKDPSSLSSYTILQVSLPPQPAYPKSATHYIYLRPDAPKSPTSDTPRSLFLSNIPIDSSEASLRTLFKQIGGALVDRVEFEDNDAKSGSILVKGQRWVKEGDTRVSGKKRKRDRDIDNEGKEKLALPATWEFKVRRSGSCAVVVFVDRATAEAVLKECIRMAKRKEKVEWRSTEELGEKRRSICLHIWIKANQYLTVGYRKHHALIFPPRDVLQSNVNAYLAEYAALEQERAKKLKQLRSEPDEDGFITVTRGGRVGPARIETAQAVAERHKEREKKRVGGAFYRFQTREEAKKRERELRKKFEEDVKRIEDMRRTKGKIRPE